MSFDFGLAVAPQNSYSPQISVNTSISDASTDFAPSSAFSLSETTASASTAITLKPTYSYELPLLISDFSAEDISTLTLLP